MKKLLIAAMLLAMATNIYAGYGRGGSSGGRSFSGGRSYSSYSRPSYSSPSYRSYSSPSRSYSNHTVVHHTSGSGLGGGGIGSHLGAGALGYMLGSSNNHVPPPVYVNSANPPVQQTPMSSQEPTYSQPMQSYDAQPPNIEGVASFFRTIFWTILFCFGVTVFIWLIIKRNEL